MQAGIGEGKTLKKRILPAESSDSASSDTESSFPDEEYRDLMMALRKKAASKTENVLSGYAPARLALRTPPAVPAAAGAPAPKLPASGLDSAGTRAPPAAPATAAAPAPELPASGVDSAGTIAAPAAPPRIARPRGPNEPRIIATFGRATLSETYEGGTHVGFRMTC